MRSLLGSRNTTFQKSGSNLIDSFPFSRFEKLCTFLKSQLLLFFPLPSSSSSSLKKDRPVLKVEKKIEKISSSNEVSETPETGPKESEQSNDDEKKTDAPAGIITSESEVKVNNATKTEEKSILSSSLRRVSSHDERRRKPEVKRTTKENYFSVLKELISFLIYSSTDSHSKGYVHKKSADSDENRTIYNNIEFYQERNQKNKEKIWNHFLEANIFEDVFFFIFLYNNNNGTNPSQLDDEDDENEGEEVERSEQSEGMLLPLPSPSPPSSHPTNQNEALPPERKAATPQHQVWINFSLLREFQKEFMSSFNLLLLNLQNENCVYYLLSNRRINQILNLIFVNTEGEFLIIFFSFLKSLIIRLNEFLVQFFIITPTSSTGSHTPISPQTSTTATEEEQQNLLLRKKKKKKNQIKFLLWKILEKYFFVFFSPSSSSSVKISKNTNSRMIQIAIKTSILKIINLSFHENNLFKYLFYPENGVSKMQFFLEKYFSILKEKIFKIDERIIHDLVFTKEDLRKSRKEIETNNFKKKSKKKKGRKGSNSSGIDAMAASQHQGGKKNLKNRLDNLTEEFEYFFELRNLLAPRGGEKKELSEEEQKKKGFQDELEKKFFDFLGREVLVTNLEEEMKYFLKKLLLLKKERSKRNISVFHLFKVFLTPPPMTPPHFKPQTTTTSRTRSTPASPASPNLALSHPAARKILATGSDKTPQSSPQIKRIISEEVSGQQASTGQDDDTKGKLHLGSPLPSTSASTVHTPPVQNRILNIQSPSSITTSTPPPHNTPKPPAKNKSLFVFKSKFTKKKIHPENRKRIMNHDKKKYLFSFTYYFFKFNFLNELLSLQLTSTETPNPNDTFLILPSSKETQILNTALQSHEKSTKGEDDLLINIKKARPFFLRSLIKFQFKKINCFLSFFLIQKLPEEEEEGKETQKKTKRMENVFGICSLDNLINCFLYLQFNYKFIEQKIVFHLIYRIFIKFNFLSSRSPNNAETRKVIIKCLNFLISRIEKKIFSTTSSAMEKSKEKEEGPKPGQLNITVSNLRYIKRIFLAEYNEFLKYAKINNFNLILNNRGLILFNPAAERKRKPSENTVPVVKQPKKNLTELNKLIHFFFIVKSLHSKIFRKKSYLISNFLDISTNYRKNQKFSSSSGFFGGDGKVKVGAGKDQAGFLLNLKNKSNLHKVYYKSKEYYLFWNEKKNQFHDHFLYFLQRADSSSKTQEKTKNQSSSKKAHKEEEKKNDEPVLIIKKIKKLFNLEMIDSTLNMSNPKSAIMNLANEVNNNSFLNQFSFILKDNDYQPSSGKKRNTWKNYILNFDNHILQKECKMQLKKKIKKIKKEKVFSLKYLILRREDETNL